MNKRGTYYKVLDLDGVLDAVLPGQQNRGRYDSAENCREVIDRNNESRKKNGLPVKRCVIALFYWERNYNPDGTFKELIETTTAIETYPAT